MQFSCNLETRSRTLSGMDYFVLGEKSMLKYWSVQNIFETGTVNISYVFFTQLINMKEKKEHLETFVLLYHFPQSIHLVWWELWIYCTCKFFKSSSNPLLPVVTKTILKNIAYLYPLFETKPKLVNFIFFN